MWNILYKFWWRVLHYFIVLLEYILYEKMTFTQIIIIFEPRHLYIYNIVGCSAYWTLCIYYLRSQIVCKLLAVIYTCLYLALIYIHNTIIKFGSLYTKTFMLSQSTILVNSLCTWNHYLQCVCYTIFRWLLIAYFISFDCVYLSIVYSNCESFERVKKEAKKINVLFRLWVSQMQN